jgi:hypothetical protein
MIELHEVKDVAQDDIRTRETVRDEFQLARDEDVKHLHERWVKANRPAPGKGAPFQTYHVAKTDRAEL